jgi:KAP family P-loop domain
VEDRRTETVDTQAKPVWVKDLIAWLKKIEGLNLTGDEWVARVQEVLAEVPGQGLPEELWQKARESAETAEAVQEKVEVELSPLSEEAKTRIQEEMEAAQGIEHEPSRSQALIAIADQLPASESQLLQQALEAAQGIQYKYSRSQAIAAVANHLPKLERQSVLQQAIDMAKGFQDEERSRALATIPAQIPASELHPLQQALETAKQIENEDSRSRDLTADTAQIPASEPHLLRQALEAAEKLDSYEKSERIAAIVMDIPNSESSESSLFHQALDIAQNILGYDENDWNCRSKALLAIISCMPESDPKLLGDAFEAAQKETQYNRLTRRFVGFDIAEEQRLPLIVASINRIPPSNIKLLQQALKLALNFQYESCRLSILLAIIAKVSPREPQFLQEVIQSALSLEEKDKRIAALTNIAFQFTELLIPKLPLIQLSTALEIIPKSKKSTDKVRLISALAPRLSPGLFPRALQLVQTEITHPAYQAESLGNLAPYLPSKSLSEALEIVQDHIPGYTYPTDALCHLIPYLSLPQLKQALVICEKRNLDTHPELLTRLLHQAAIRLSKSNHLQSEPDSSTDKVRISRRILVKLIKLTHYPFMPEKGITKILIDLIPSINENCLRSIQDYILPKLKSEFYHAQALAAIAVLHNITLEKIISLDQKDIWQQDRAKAVAFSAFITIAPELRADVITLIKNSNNIYKAELALILAIRPHPDPYNYSALSELKTDQIQALRLIREEPNEVAKAKALFQLAPHLLPSQILETQGIAQDIQDRYQRSRSLLALATHFPEIRAEAQRQIEQIKNKHPEKDTSKDKYLILHIELLSQFAKTVPEQISVLLNAIEDWSKDNLSDSERDRPTYKRRRILIALKPHLPIRLVREIDRETGIGKAPQDLWERALFVLRNEYRQALKTGSLRNDATQDEDLLNLKDEINALTEMLLMRDLEPPVAVGILGGWGGGKSYIMHLMQTHMTEIRSQRLETIEAWGLANAQSKIPDGDRVGRFVGHVYQIKFDAWTYAKADLWASLMQTIFFELDRQLTLETQLNEVFDKSTLEDSQKQAIQSRVWPVLYKSSDDEREWFLKEVLKDKEILDELLELQKEQKTGILWQRFKESQITAIHNLNITENALKAKKKELEEAKSNLQNQISQAFSPILNLSKNKKINNLKRYLALPLCF